MRLQMDDSKGEKNPTVRELERLGVSIDEKQLDLSSHLGVLGVQNCYVIVMTGRSGSTWLAESLNQIPGAGYPLEYFTDDSLARYYSGKGGQNILEFAGDIIKDYSKNGVFSFKIDPLRLRWLESVIATVPSFGRKWIDLRRLDLVGQAFSFARAKKSGFWHNFGQNLNSKQKTVITDEDVLSEIKIILENEKWIDNFYLFHGLRPLRIFYEELRQNLPCVLLRVLHHIDSREHWGDVLKTEDRVTKIAGSVEMLEEVDFYRRNITLISEILERRKVW